MNDNVTSPCYLRRNIHDLYDICNNEEEFEETFVIMKIKNTVQTAGIISCSLYRY